MVSGQHTETLCIVPSGRANIITDNLVAGSVDDMLRWGYSICTPVDDTLYIVGQFASLFCDGDIDKVPAVINPFHSSNGVLDTIKPARVQADADAPKE
mgnify:CR=1 FL=1